ncbi:MAG: hypothetical protein DRP01_10985 [Archaeoglobales archaeon]|nr:MAG: hypothetical protein DRP01_10985 [Archaeoglobales archaeon]
MRNKKILTIPILTFALISIGLAYAHWSETLYISGTVNTGKLDWGFDSWHCLDQGVDYHCRDGFACAPGEPRYWPDPDGKDVGWQELVPHDYDKDGDYEVLDVILHNVYPSYFTSISIYPRNTGSIPLIIDKVIIKNNIGTVIAIIRDVPAPVVKLDLNGDGKDDIEILWSDNFGKQLDPGEDDVEISFWIHVLQDAPKGATLSFTIELVAIQWNKYVPP